MTSGLGLLLALLCAVGWSVLDALRKGLGQRMSAQTAAGALAALGTLPFAVMLAIDPPSSAPTAPFWLCVAGSAVLNITANTLFVRAVQLSPLALTIPYLGFSPVFVLVGGAVFLGQQPTLLSIAGILLVVVGAVALNPRIEGEPFNPLRALIRERGSVLVLAVALLWSAGALVDRTGVQYGGIPLYGTFTNLCTGLPLLAWSALRQEGQLERVRSALPLLGAAVLALSFAMVMQFLAWDHLFIAYADAIKRAGGMLFSTLLGYLFFGERQLRQRLPAVATMGLGVGIVLAGSG